MSLERLEKLFEALGRAAEEAARLRVINEQAAAAAAAGGPVAVGGPVAQSEMVRNIRDIKAQTAQAVSLAGGSGKPAELVQEIRLEIAKLIRASEGRKADSSAVGGPVERSARAILGIADFVRRQEEAGRAVTRFTRALAYASSFLYSFTTGRVITRSGRTLPGRRALAVALRRLPGTKRLRGWLQAPDRLLRPAMRELRGALGRPAAKPLRAAPAGVSAGRDVLAAARAASVARAGAASAGTAAAARGAATAAAGIASMSALGAAAGAVGAFIGALILAVIAMRKFTTAAASFAQSMLQRQFAELAPRSAHYSLAQARLQAFEIRDSMSRGTASGPTAILLTDALIKLRQEMGPITRAAMIYGHLFAYSLVQIARLLNAILMIGKPAIEIAEKIAYALDRLLPKTEIPLASFLKDLEEARTAKPRTPPPQGGFPPWQ